MRESQPNSLPNVLIVDDDERIVGVLCRILEFDCKIYSASSVLGALEVLDREGPFAVVLTDFRMPGANGTDLILRAQEKHPHTVYVILTGTQDDSGCDDIQVVQPFRVLIKPCQIAEIRHAVAEAVKLYAERTGTVFGFCAQQ